MTIIADDSTIASNPGRINISLNKFSNVYKLNSKKRLLLKFYNSLPPSFLSFIFNFSSTAHLFISTKEKFEYGCINPAIIVNKNKSLVAVFTSLTAHGTKSYPVIKIYKEKLNFINNIEIDNGTKIGTVAFYSRTAQDPYPESWVDFHPQVPNCFTDNHKDCERIVQSIKDEAWEALYLGLEQIDKNQEGLHNLILDNELVQNSY